MKIRMEIELDYNADTQHGNDEDSRKWFYGEILSGDRGKLLLHSNEIGDTIGKVNVISINEAKQIGRAHV